MAITYPVSPDSKWTIYDTDASAIIDRNQDWPREDLMEIQGLPANIVYLEQTQDTPPTVDNRLYRLEQNETLDIPNNTVTKTWQSVARSVEERVVSAENKEVEELGKHVAINRTVIETQLVVGAILNHIGGLQLPPKVTQFVDAYEARAIKIWKNRDRLNSILAEIANGGDPDLDAGWEPEPVE